MGRDADAAGESDVMSATGAIQVLVLGPCVARLDPLDGSPSTFVELSAFQRRILCRLALARPGSVSAEELAEAVWGDDQPATARTAIHNQVSRIRRKVGPEVLRTRSGRYELVATTDLDDVLGELATVEALVSGSDPGTARIRADEALGLWRGPAFDDLAETAENLGVLHQVDELQRSLETLRLQASILEGRAAWAVPEAERLIATTPHDEHRWMLLMQALDAAGRRGDALGAFERARRTLADELGLSPGPELRAAESDILRAGGEPGPGTPSRLVGRDDLVETALVQVAAQHVVVLTGEPGVGKSRLLAELAGRLRRRGAVMARGSCAQHTETAISTLAGLTGDLGVTMDASLPPVTAFIDALTGLTPEVSPVVLCVDDLDLGGPTTVGALVTAASIEGIALLATATEPEVLPAELQTAVLAIPELSDDGVRALASDRLGTEQPDGALVSWLTRMSGGNPLLAEYLLEDLSLRNSTAPDDDVALGPSPALRDLVRRRLDRVGATTRSALRAAAVCGPTFPEELLCQLVPEQGIAGAVAAGILRSEISDDELTRSMSFRHHAVQRILYDDLSPGRRMEIHHRAVGILEAMGAAAPTIAVHAAAAIELDPLDAANRCIAAARAATALGAHADAAGWYDMAVAATVDGRRMDRLRVVALIGRGDALRLSGSPDQEAALFDAADAAVALGVPELIGDAAFAVLQLGATTESGSLHGRGVELADHALRVVTDREQRAMIAGAASLAHSMTGAAPMCRRLFLEAEASAAEPGTRRHVLPFAYLGLGHPADLPLREQLTAELLVLGLQADDPVSLFEAHQLSFSIGIQRADGPRVRDAVRELEHLVLRVGDIGRRWALLYQQAAVAHLDGDLARSEALATEALELFSAVSPSRAFAAYGGQLLPLRIAQGRLAELVPTLADLVREQPEVPAWRAALALAIAEEDPGAALEHAVAALDGVEEDFTWLAAHLIGGRAAALIGDVTACDRYARRLLPHSGLVCWQGTCAYGPVDAVLAMLLERLGDAPTAAELARRANVQAASLQAPVFHTPLDEAVADTTV